MEHSETELRSSLKFVARYLKRRWLLAGSPEGATQSCLKEIENYLDGRTSEIGLDKLLAKAVTRLELAIKAGFPISVSERMGLSIAKGMLAPKIVPPSVNATSLHAAEEALAAHQKALGLEGDLDVQVWQLLVSLHEYCVANALDFDVLLADVRARLSSGELGLLASEAYVKAKSIAAVTEANGA